MRHRSRGRARSASTLFLIVAIALLAGQTLYRLGTIHWSSEEGSHGPILLASGAWLLWRQWRQSSDLASPPSWLASVLALGGAAFVFLSGVLVDIFGVEIFGAYLLGLATIYTLVGTAMVKRLWFPLIYLAFLIPLPETLVTLITGPLKSGISTSVAFLLSAAGFPIVNSGVVLQIGPYELLVAAACSGLNAIISLSAIGLFYVYLLHRANWRYALVLIALVLPAAIIANFIRVLLLVLITYWMGDAAAQGFLHNLSGMVTFAAAILFIFAADHLLAPLRERLSKPRSAGAAE